jgi:four helix bundle protein
MHDYKKLEVWKLSMEFTKHVYELTEKLPHEEKFGLTSQIRRSAVSIPSNIAEGAGRNSKKEFSHFLSISLGSTFELETQLLLAKKLNFFLDINLDNYMNELDSIGKMIHSLRKSMS